MGNIFSVSLSCDTVLSRCWDCVAGQALYTCQLQENLAELRLAWDRLKERRIDVMRRVNVAEQGNMKRLDEVEGWLSRAEAMIHEVDQLIIDGPGEISKLCMGGCCSMNCKSSHRFGKRVAKRLHDVGDLITEGASFQEVAITVPSPSVVERPNDSAVGLESVFNKVRSSMAEEQVGIIGLYGKGGVGKTRLMTEINNKIGGEFDVVIWLVVSKGFKIGKVQDDIAERIGLYGTELWNEKTSEKKATEIFKVLKGKKFALLLDDIWKRVDICKVGIPSPTQLRNGSKLIFTTRSLDVCGQMGAHKKIEVTCLPKEEAWELFEQHVGKEILDSHPNIPELARDVAKECGGLPLALITIGRAMACKTQPQEWEYALDVLRRPTNFVFPNMGEEVYPLLKFSYDSLSDDIFRSCLLYCSLFSEDYKIEKEMLIDCWIGEGILDEHDNLSQSRNQGHHVIGSLLHACLLEEVGDGYIKMHDVIRDMSLWIACKCEAEKWKFHVEANYGLTKVPKVEKWRDIRRMSLMQNKIQCLTQPPNCPHLQTLFLNENSKLRVIHDNFFQFMCGLKVLSLRSSGGITEVPVGISKLVSLEYLDLSGTNIKHLPIELKALKKLKCLDLQWIGDITIPRGLIFSFSKLKILKMLGSFPFDEKVKDSNECLVEELQCLNYLISLSMSLRDNIDLIRFLNAQRLYSCVDVIGIQHFSQSKQLNILSLTNFKCLNALTLDHYRLKEVKTEWEGKMIKAPTQVQISVNPSAPCFQSLLQVTIVSCSELRDATWIILAPNLRYLSVTHCYELEEIINETKLGQMTELVGTLGPFAKLKTLHLHFLPELKSIYWDALLFSCMNQNEVYGCPKLRRLPLNSNSAKGNKISIRGYENWWKELQWEDESTLNAFLPCFVAV